MRPALPGQQRKWETNQEDAAVELQTGLGALLDRCYDEQVKADDNLWCVFLRGSPGHKPYRMHPHAQSTSVGCGGWSSAWSAGEEELRADH